MRRPFFPRAASPARPGTARCAPPLARGRRENALPPFKCDRRTIPIGSPRPFFRDATHGPARNDRLTHRRSRIRSAAGKRDDPLSGCGRASTIAGPPPRGTRTTDAVASRARKARDHRRPIAEPHRKRARHRDRAHRVCGTLSQSARERMSRGPGDHRTAGGTGIEIIERASGKPRGNEQHREAIGD